MVYHERPGVYADYELSTAASYSKGGKTVAAAVYAEEVSELTVLTSERQAKTLLTQSETALNLVKLLFLNGAGTVLLCPVNTKTADGYGQAAEVLLAEKSATIMILDTDNGALQTAVAEAIRKAAQEGNYCVGICGMDTDSVLALTEQAQSLNSERMVLVGGTAALSWTPAISGGIYGAAALAGALAGETDPAAPMNGAELLGLSAVAQRFSESEIDSLVQGGVTILESLGSIVSVVRAVTTRTTTDGTADSSWRELTTIMIVDDVIPGIRNSLRRRFVRKKNNEATRGAICSQVAVELESRLRREIINGYGDITAEMDEEDPTICNVSFSFVVVHGISRIYLTAHITV